MLYLDIKCDIIRKNEWDMWIMKTLGKILLRLTLLMTTVVMINTTETVQAETVAADYLIHQGETVSVIVPKRETGEVYVKFTPETSGVYRLHSDADSETNNPFCELLDENLERIHAEDDIDDWNLNFCLEVVMSEGKTYYFALSDFRGERSWDIALTNITTEIEAIKAGETKEVTVPWWRNGRKFLKFQPETSGYYTLSSEADGWPYAELYSETGEVLATATDRTDWNFVLVNEFQSGEIYYYSVSDRIDNASYKVSLVKGEDICTENHAATYCASRRFRDLQIPSWYHLSVDHMLEKEIMKGTGNDCFFPTMPTSRAMAVTMFYRAARRNVTDTMMNACTFTDIDKNQWYSEAVAWASYNNIVKGTGDNCFSPDRDITRQEFVVMLYNLAENRYGTYMTHYVHGGLENYVDKEQVATWARKAVEWAVSRGIMQGIPSETGALINPTGGVSRAEAATLLFRFLEFAE